MTTATAAIRHGTAGPESLGTFWLRKMLWKHAGMRLEDWQILPWREAEEYVFYIQTIEREESEQQRRANSGRR